MKIPVNVASPQFQSACCIAPALVVVMMMVGLSVVV